MRKQVQRPCRKAETAFVEARPVQKLQERKGGVVDSGTAKIITGVAQE